jgi:hypothetical protein
MLAVVRGKGFYALRDPQEKLAIAGLRQRSEHAAPAVAAMLADGLKNREHGWIEVYRPLFIMDGMGVHARAGLPYIILALGDKHPINVDAAARVLAQIGPAAKDGLPELQRAWESAMPDSNARKSTATAIKAIDPKLAEKLGIP